MKEIKFAMLGYGGIAKSHKHGYELLEAEGFPIKLVAICDIDESQFTAAEEAINLGTTYGTKLDGIALYTDIDKMLTEVDFDVIDICLPSYLHKEYAIKLMESGKHVLSEKPMSLSYDDCKEMLRVANALNKKITIGQCLHFEAGYVYLKKCVESGLFGKLQSLTLDRLSELPTWKCFESWYLDPNRSGSAPFDLHIHDIDMANYLLGMPSAVSSVTLDNDVPMQYINSRLFYDNGVTVFATASWNEVKGTPFLMSYRARFDKATLLYKGGAVTVYPTDGKPYEAEETKRENVKDRMAEEIRNMALAVGDADFINTVNTPECAASSILLTEKLVESAKKNGEKIYL